jgi:hypothetical protein
MCLDVNDAHGGDASGGSNGSGSSDSDVSYLDLNDAAAPAPGNAISQPASATDCSLSRPGPASSGSSSPLSDIDSSDSELSAAGRRLMLQQTPAQRVHSIHNPPESTFNTQNDLSIRPDPTQVSQNTMAENIPPTTAAGGANNSEPFDRAKEMAEYEKEKQNLKDLIGKRATLARNLSHIEAKIVDLEGKYIESTPGGNILTGFDNYTKGITGAAAQRRKAGTTEQNRVFSRSSISYNALNVCNRFLRSVFDLDHTDSRSLVV